MTTDRVRDVIAAIEDARAQRAERPPSLFDPPAEPSRHAPIGVSTNVRTAVTSEARAVRAVERAAGRAWSNHVVDVIRRLATTHVELTVDDIAPAIEYPVHDLRALGPAMKRAAKLGLIKPTGEYRISERPEAHSRPLRVWASCIAESRCA